MPKAYKQADSHVPFDMGPVLQAVMSADDAGIVATVPASGNIVSNLIYMNGYKVFAFAIKSTQNGSISIQRYLDADGLIAQGSALTASLTANTQAVYNLNDAILFQSMKITINNTGGSDATLSNVLLLMQAN